MADFDQIRHELRAAREVRDEASAALAHVRERIKSLDARLDELNRVASPNRPEGAELARLRAARGEAEADLKRHSGARASAVADEARLVKDFARFTDPRQGIGRFNDQIPILMMPVRLETRFKTDVAGGDPANQLWVRIFPDDCWIDSFDPVLTNAEVAGAKAYWISIWQAGGIESREDAAWVALATTHGSGRASWIVSQYQPVNLAAKPLKAREEDVILTIAGEPALAADEEAPVAAFWRSMWLADGEADRSAAAAAALAAVVGEARAGEIATGYVPANFSAPLSPGSTKTTVEVSVAFLRFPIVETKRTAWSQAPKAVILPDRFVFLGYQTEDDPNPLVALGNPVPSPLLVGPDPSAPEEEQLRPDGAGNLVVPEELRWLSDFDRAVEVGMGFRINLNPLQASRGFKRVLVLGLRLNAGADSGKSELETLLAHHSLSRTGLAILPQGTPTNNTEAAPSGASRVDDPNQSLEDRKRPPLSTESGWLDKKDGQWVAEYLGIDTGLFARLHQAESTDQLTARAMNTALWPATLGYWMETMMAPVFPSSAIEQTRAFFNQYVVAAGACPAIRIGAQPYGILPATPLSRMNWLTQPRGSPERFAADPMLSYLRSLYPILKGIDQDFRAKLAEISFVGKAGDPHALLLDIVGLHPGSVEWSQRYAESLKTFFNRANLRGLGGFVEALTAALQRVAAEQRLRGFGYGGDQVPPILDLIFNRAHNRLKGGVVDDVPLSETDPVRPSTTDGRNYLQWLIDAAATSLDALYTQQGFKDDKAPTALLYLLLRHALQLGYHDVTIRLHEAAGLCDPARALQARADDPFLHIRDNKLVSESRYEPLYAIAPAITGSDTAPVHEFIGARLPSLFSARYLREQVDALQRLKGQSTARLERAFADHVDCCAYRLDAWLLGLVNYQLGLMRNLRDGGSEPPRQGIFLGAYAWLEDLAPEKRSLSPVRLQDPTLIELFQAADEPPLTRDSANQGYVHAPSPNHAVAAAVLRNGFLSNATPANRQTMAVNLTSERVRTALALIEGIRAGQGLADLLGYQFERGLHDRHSLAEVDKFIFKLRKAFPLRADRLKATKTAEGVPIESIEARNVIDGLALVEHIKATDNKSYPFGKPGLPPPTQAEAEAINAEVDRLLESHDAVADLALSEGVYQAVLGNYDRVASTYDAYARGNFPPEPDIIRTPANGIGLTHRVTLHLPAGADPTVSPTPGLAMTPRAQAEPALNQWLTATLPSLDQISCLVSFREAATGTDRSREVTLLALGLQPADWIALVRDDNQQTMTELDDRILRFAYSSFGPRPDVPISIRYLEKQAAAFSVFEAMPLARNLRRITTKSRALRSSDLSLMNEARSEQDSQPFVDKARLDSVRAALATLRDDITAFRIALDAPLADLENRRAEVISNADTYVTDLASLLSRAAAFAIPQAGWGFAYDFRQRNFASILKRCQDLVLRWDAKIATFDARIADAAAAVGDEEKFAFLRQAEQAISTATTIPLPASPAAFEATLTGTTLPAFVAKRDEFDAVGATTRTSISQLLADVQGLLPVTPFDFVEFTLAPIEDEMVRFAQDASGLIAVILTEIERRLSLSASLFVESDNSADPSAKVQAMEGAARALLGEDFKVFPEFPLTPLQSGEIANAVAASASGDLFLYLTAPPPEAGRDPLDFPVDDWLYGIARVREKMFAWEQTLMFAGALGGAEPELTPLQLPFAPGDRWLGLEIPPQQTLDRDRLLYTAHFAAPFDPNARQCGLLIDEWTETIPAATIDTGVAFHHDRPNCEAPQAMLLVTPSEFRGAWRWDDLVDALHETLDFAKRRAIEPKHLDSSPYAPFLPATVVATQVRQLTIAAELALNNKIAFTKQS